MSRRSVYLPIELRIVRFIFLEHVVNGGEQHSGNGNNGFLVSPAFLEREIAVADFRELLGTNRIEGALHKQRLDVGSGPADSGGFLLPCALIVLRRESSLGLV